MVWAGVANKENPLFDAVASLSVGAALVNAVDEVDALADGVTLNYSVAHCCFGWKGLKIVGWSKGIECGLRVESFLRVDARGGSGRGYICF
jgi:hypothetical protein